MARPKAYAFAYPVDPALRSRLASDGFIVPPLGPDGGTRPCAACGVTLACTDKSWATVQAARMRLYCPYCADAVRTR